MPGRYYITKLAGKNPAGELFLALDATDKTGKVTEFHLQRYRHEFCANENFVAALEAEVQVELSLSHPLILRLHDYGTWEGLCYLMYEKYPSISLREALSTLQGAGERVEPLVAAAIALQLLDLLLYTHGIPEATGGRKPAAFTSGFSPECVDLDGAGQLKVRGFTRAGTAARPNFLDMALGRMPYLAPEIWEGGQPTPRSDLFSLGALLWELLSGQPLPKGGATTSAIGGEVPREISQFLFRLLGTQGSFGTAAEAKAALEKALFTLGQTAGPGDLAAWHRSLHRILPKGGIKEVKESTQRAVLAEISATRRLLTVEAAEAEAMVSVADPAPQPEAPPAPRKEETKSLVAKNTSWLGSATFREAAAGSEEVDPAVSKAQRKKLLQLAAGGALSLALFVGGGWLAYRNMYGEPPAVNAEGLPGGPFDLQVAFAYDAGGAVTLQGIRNDPAKAFGPEGMKLSCEFLLAPDEDTAASRAEGEYSAKFNFAQCPSGDPNHKFVRVATGEEKPRRSNPVPIRSTLSWRNVLGPDLVKTRVSWVYRFTCDRTFVEGEGVSKEGAVSCPPSQKLGVLHAIYHYYARWSEEEKEAPEEIPVATESACGLSSFSSWRCLDGGKILLFGLYKRELPPFNVPVSLTRAPVGENLMSVYGFAAEPDSRGNCPVGLVKVRQWNVAPPTIGPVASTGDEDDEKEKAKEKEQEGYFSTFRNESGELNNRVIEGQEPKPFVILRHKNRTPCDGQGSCAFATFEDPQPAFTLSYSPGGDFCVIPASMESAPLGDEARGGGSGVAEKPTQATIYVQTRLPDYEVYVNGQKAQVKNNSFPVRLHVELKIEIVKLGFKRVRLTLPPIEKAGGQTIEAAAEVQPMGEVDLATFPPSEATFFLGTDKVFTGQTPLKEKLPAGEYRVRLVNAQIGADTEIKVIVTEGQTTSVDQLLKGTK